VAIELDHVIVSARNQRVSAKRLVDLLRVHWAETGAGPFSPVYVNDGLTLDFIDDDGGRRRDAFADTLLDRLGARA
jgi:hypothetical protein